METDKLTHKSRRNFLKLIKKEYVGKVKDDVEAYALSM
jgi:hypothetical protein